MDTILEKYVRLKNLLGDVRGQGIVEYALLLLLIAIIAILMMKGIGEQTCTAYSKVNNAFQ